MTRQHILITVVLCVAIGVAIGAPIDDRFDVEELPYQNVVTPVQVKFGANDQVFVLEKQGRIKKFDGLDDLTSGTTLCDLQTKVYSWWDHGMLGMELHPNFEENGIIFVAYTAAAWSDGTPTDFQDNCPGEYCESSARVSRLNTLNGQCEEEELLAGACSTSPAHHISDVFIGHDGYLYVSIGDSSHFSFADYGTDPETGELEFCVTNPDEDIAATAETGYGAYRAQNDALTQGKLLRIDPDVVLPFNHDPRDLSVIAAPINDDPTSPIIAKGLRMPFRMVQHPSNSDIFIGDVGGGIWETIWQYKLDEPSTSDTYPNFGWPCREGGQINNQFSSEFCDAADQEPLFAYHHATPIGDCAATGSSSVSALGFYTGDAFPMEYEGALFFGDFARECIWYIPVDEDGEFMMDGDEPKIETFDTKIAFPVDIRSAPDGSLIVVSVFGSIKRVVFRDANSPPSAALDSDVFEGASPLAVQFDASISESNTGGDLTYSWDLDGDLVFGDDGIVAPTAQYTFTESGVYTVTVRVTDSNNGISDDARIEIVVDISLDPYINVPTAPWKTGDLISYSGGAIDHNGEEVPATALSWEIGLWHCIYRPCSTTEYDCHRHTLVSSEGQKSGSFPGPNHNYPSFLEVILTVNYHGITRTAMVTDWEPQWLYVTVTSEPAGADAVVAEVECVTPCVLPSIVHSAFDMIVEDLRYADDTLYEFAGWSDGYEERTRLIFPDDTANNYVALYRPVEAQYVPSLTAPIPIVSEPECESTRIFWDAPDSEEITLTHYWVRWVHGQSLFINTVIDISSTISEVHAYDMWDNSLMSGITSQETTCVTALFQSNRETINKIVSSTEAELFPIAVGGDATWAVSALGRNADGELVQGAISRVNLAKASATETECTHCPIVEFIVDSDNIVTAVAGVPMWLAPTVTSTTLDLERVVVEVTSIQAMDVEDAIIYGVSQDNQFMADPMLVYGSLLNGDELLRTQSDEVPIRLTVPAGLPTGTYQMEVAVSYASGRFDAVSHFSIPIVVKGTDSQYRIDITHIPTLVPSEYNAYVVSVAVYVEEPGYELVIDILDESYNWYGGCDLALTELGWYNYKADMLNINLPVGVELRYSSYIRPLGTSYQDAVMWWQEDPLYVPLTVTGTASSTPPNVPDLIVPNECLLDGCLRPMDQCVVEDSGVCDAISGECSWTPVTCGEGYYCEAAINKCVEQGVVVEPQDPCPSGACINLDDLTHQMTTIAGDAVFQNVRIHNSGQERDLVVNLLEKGTWKWFGGVRLTIPATDMWMNMTVEITHSSLPCVDVQLSSYLGPVGGEWTEALASAAVDLDLSEDEGCAPEEPEEKQCINPTVGCIDDTTLSPMIPAGSGYVDVTLSVFADSYRDVVVNVLEKGTWVWKGGVRATINTIDEWADLQLTIPYQNVELGGAYQYSVFMAPVGGDYLAATVNDSKDLVPYF